MTITFDSTILANLLSELIELKNFISRFQYQTDGSYSQIDQGNNQITLDRIIELSSLLNDFKTSVLIESSQINISNILSLVNSIDLTISTILNTLTTDVVTKLTDIQVGTDKISQVRTKIVDVLDILTPIYNSDFHLIISDIDEKLETIRDTHKIVSYIPYKFDNLGTCEQRVAYLYDNGNLVDSSLNPITIASIEPDIGYCP